MDISIYDRYQLLLCVYSRQVHMAPGMVFSIPCLECLLFSFLCNLIELDTLYVDEFSNRFIK